MNFLDQPPRFLFFTLSEEPVGVPHLLELSGHATTLAGSSKG